VNSEETDVAICIIFSRNNFVVQMGSLTWNGEIDPNRVIMTTAIRIPHPEYNDVNLANDIGLIQLPQDAPINGIYIHISVIQASLYWFARLLYRAVCTLHIGIVM
jgi:hypothetical protein